ncbi:MAG: PilZ domain-containing protein [Nitrospinae bacterium]|nr:PilZ domain-containing protein [Nitrospinota bacterium]
MTTANEQEKRLKIRSPFNQSISFDMIDLESNILRNISYTGIGVDISEHGLGMISDYTFKKAQVVKLHLPLQEMDRPFSVFAEVMWSRPAKSHFRTGLRFLQLNISNFGIDI